MKSWLAQGSSGRQVTLPPRTTILLMSKVSEKRKPQQHTCTHTHIWLCGIKFINERSFNLSKFSVYFFFWCCLWPDPSYSSIRRTLGVGPSRFSVILLEQRASLSHGQRIRLKPSTDNWEVPYLVKSTSKWKCGCSAYSKLQNV